MGGDEATEAVARSQTLHVLLGDLTATELVEHCEFLDAMKAKALATFVELETRQRDAVRLLRDTLARAEFVANGPEATTRDSLNRKSEGVEAAPRERADGRATAASPF